MNEKLSLGVEVYDCFGFENALSEWKALTELQMAAFILERQKRNNLKYTTDI